MYKVYKHTCPNGKVYIGITGNEPSKRWNGGHGYNNNPHFKSAIIKYGWGNITHEILSDGLTKEEAEQKEIELIAHYKSNNPAFGYNHENGGGCAGKVSEETKRKISVSLTGIKRKPLSKETKQKISESKKGKPTRNYTSLSSETKEKISRAIKGRKKPAETVKKASEAHEKNVVCVETNIVYKSLKNAEEKTGVKSDSICGVCKGKRKTAGGYHWKYVVKG